jgi:methionyl-tRNA synthetase
MPLADRFVVGLCPVCKKPTKGDQCDGCNQLEKAIDIVDPKCFVCGKPPQIMTVEHLCLNLKKVEPELHQWAKDRISNWSSNAQSITKDWLNKGLEPRSITRDLKWGIPVPKPGFTDKVFYVWFDAPIGYISMTA